MRVKRTYKVTAQEAPLCFTVYSVSRLPLSPLMSPQIHKYIKTIYINKIKYFRMQFLQVTIVKLVSKDLFHGHFFLNLI